MTGRRAKLMPVIALGALIGSFAFGAPAEARNMHFHWKGVPIYVIPNDAFDHVTVQIVTRTGSLEDPDGKEGLAWLGTQLLLRGTARHPGASFAEEVETLGSLLEAHTTKESLTLSGDALLEHVDAFCALLAEALLAPSFTDAEIARWKGLALAEMARVRDSDEDLVRDAFTRYAFRGHTLGRPTLGREITQKAIVRADLVAWHERTFTAGNLLIGFAGNITPERAKELLDKHFGALRSGAPKTRAWKAPKLESRRRLLVLDKADRTQAQIAFGHVTLPVGHPDYLALLVGNTVFGGTLTSRLGHEIREVRGWSYGAYSTLLSGRRAASLLVQYFPDIEVAGRALDLGVTLFDLMARDGVTPAEAKQAKDYLGAAHAFRIETAARRLDFTMSMAVAGLDDELAERWVDKVRAVSLAKVNDALKRHFVASALVGVVVGPAASLGKALANSSAAFAVQVARHTVDPERTEAREQRIEQPGPAETPRTTTTTTPPGDDEGEEGEEEE